jgi:predicted nucleotidyltransferase
MSRSIVKTVKKYGNSGGVYVPSNWIGGKVKIDLVDEPLNPKKVLNVINLEHIISVIIYGSYVRKEISKDSDVDMIIVTDEDAKIKIPDELGNEYDVQIKTVKEIENAMTRDPVFHKIIMDESAALMNHQFLDDLRKGPLKSDSIITRLELAESSLDIIKEIFNADDSAEITYPLVMRIKEVLILEFILTNKKYSTHALRDEFLNYGISSNEFSNIMNVYRKLRSNKKSAKYQLPTVTVKKLISLLEMKIQNVKQKSK